ncbi:sensor histidine kinase [Rubricoccus marinus]|uniref:Histidine kinase domain-containing protein n=1 Tax=Rubricoccus marinus TaxID=716817 RepID=A0A259TY58_9BACT|nr:histidine kinase [Rubricoccus marinus]OZC02703.1 hypothetical protein BSZ36_06770 [Rubricoccus marinus]
MTPEAPLPRLTWRGVGFVAAVYVALAVVYAATIAGSYLTVRPLAETLATFAVLVPRSLLDYAIKGALTLPVWWLVVRGMDRRGSGAQLAAHAFLGPLWVAAWFWTYRPLAAALGYSILTGGGEVWDIYIPALIYAGQFAAFHAVRTVAKERYRADREHLLRDAARQAELSALKAQLNPHFLFNTLNSISASVPPQAEHTRELVSRLAHLMRYALDASRRETVALDAELQFTRAYLDLEQERIGDRLRVEWDVDSAARGLSLPPMLVQPLVENAVRHGIAPSIEGGTVRVSARLRGSTLAIEVADTGRGLASGESVDLIASRTRTDGGVGLGNTHARLLSLGASGVEIDATPGEPGFAVRFALEVERPESPLAPEAGVRRDARFATPSP